MPTPVPCRNACCCFLVSFAPGPVEVGAELLGHRLDEPLEVLAAGAGPRRDGALGQRQVAVRDDELGVDLEAGAEAVAGLAGAVGRVEREVARGQLLEGAVAVRAGQVLGEGEGVVGLAVLGPADGLAVAPHQLHLGHAVGQAQRRLERVGEAALEAVAHDEPVDDHLDGVLLVAGQVDLVGELVDLAVDPGPGVALGGEVGEQRLVGALAARAPPARAPGSGCPRAARGCDRRSAAGVCRVIWAPHSGQCGTPMRA